MALFLLVITSYNIRCRCLRCHGLAVIAVVLNYHHHEYKERETKHTLQSYRDIGVKHLIVELLSGRVKRGNFRNGRNVERILITPRANGKSDEILLIWLRGLGGSESRTNRNFAVQSVE